MIKDAKQTLTESSVLYQARTKLTKLSLEIASAKDLDSVVNQLLLATKIRLWTKALDYKKYLTKAQRDKLLYSLVDISNIYSFPKSPVLDEVSAPAELINTSVKVRR